MGTKEAGAVLAYEVAGTRGIPSRLLLEALPWCFFFLFLDAMLEYPASIFEPIFKDFKVNLPDVSKLYLILARNRNQEFMPLILICGRVAFETLVVCLGWRNWSSGIRTWLLVLIGLELGDMVLHVMNWLVAGGIDNSSMHFQSNALGLGHAMLGVMRGISVVGALKGVKRSGGRPRFGWVVVIACGLLVGLVIVALFMPMVALMGAVSGSKRR